MADNPSVKPLRCPACDAPVPLGDADVVPCLACGAQVPVPAELRELRAAEREDRADRARAEHLYKKLGKPPGTLLTAWVNIFVLGLGAIMAVIYGLVAIGGVFMIFIVVGLELLLHALAGPFGIDFIDRYGGGWTYAGFAAILVVFGALPMWLASYLQKTGEVRLGLQAGLSAHRQTRPGFPATCRECGAALEVPPNAYGVRCTYCRADNLVSLPAEWLDRAKSASASIHSSIVESVKQVREVRKEQLATLGLIAAIGAIVIAAMGLVGHIAAWIDEDDAFNYHWSQSYGPPRMLERWNGGDIPVNERTENVGDAWIALRHREVFEIAVYNGPCPHVTLYNTTTFPFFQRFDRLSFGIAADGSRVARYRAPYTGIFQVEVRKGDMIAWHLATATPPALAPLTGCDD